MHRDDTSKRQMINWIYQDTDKAFVKKMKNQKIIVVGVIANTVSYLKKGIPSSSQ